MIHAEHAFSLLVLLVGLTMIATILLRIGLRRLHIPPLVGFMALGLVIRVADGHWAFMSANADAVFSFLARVGVVALLFRIGLESNLKGLLRQLPRAGLIWAGNVVLSAVAGYAAATWLLDLPLIPSLFAAVSLTATSVGVSMAVWRQKKSLKSSNGELLVDVAELDDISGVGLMAVLFAIVPVLQSGAEASLLPNVLKTAAWFTVKLLGFTLFCFLFSRYAEKKLTRVFKRGNNSATTMLMVTGTGFVIAAIAGWLGFSLAIGALFAGLLFSRDPDAVKFDASFESLHELFTPFFFVGIGLSMDPAAVVDGLAIGTVLVVVAVLPKVIGAGAPALLSTDRTGALLIGLSMVPRAEIAMIIMQRGRQLGDDAVPASLFSGMVLVSAVTCVAVPWLLAALLERWPQRQQP